MADTTFSSGTTVASTWLQDANDHTYDKGAGVKHAASKISVTPAVTITSTDVQAALEELSTAVTDITDGLTFTGNVNVPSLNGGQLAGTRNKIINGKMDVAQRGTSFPAIASGAYSLDRWVIGANTTAAILTASQAADGPSGEAFQNSLRLAVTTADATIAATDNFTLNQRIEGYNVRDLIGKTFTLSFWVRSSKTGVHCVSFINSGVDRSYVAEYVINAASTWEYKSITVSGGFPAAGTWDWTNGIGLNVRWSLASGSNSQNTAGTWQTGNFSATANQVNVLDTVGNIFAITGVQLEVGAVATPFEHRQIGTELSMCQRYYEIGAYAQVGYSSFGTYIRRPFMVEKRATPTMTISNIDYLGLGATGASAIAYSTREFQGNADWTSTAAYRAVVFDWRASAEL